MAYNNDQEEYPLPENNNGKRTSAQHLPRYFRTEVNKKFLSGTLDQLLQPGVAEKVNGYLGRKYAKAFRQNDNYVTEPLKQRADYQFEPVAVIKDELGNVDFYADYNDYINQLRNLDSAVENHSVLNQQEYYAWDPHIDWDKFTNFREYYWLPNGPQPIPIAGENVEVETTYTVTNEDNLDNRGFIFSGDLTQNPNLVLYRGITYVFEIDSPNLPISFRTNRIIAQPWSARTFYRLGESVLYEGQIYTVNNQHRSSSTFEEDRQFWDLNIEFNLTNEVSQQNVEQGTIEITLNQETPDFLYYVSDKDINASGLIRVYDIEEAAFINVEQELIGKKRYLSGNGVDISNGQLIYFIGSTEPKSFETGNYFVEGVGDSIQLIPQEDLTLSSAFVENEQINFDAEGFDTVPFSTAIGFPREKDYITINRSALNGNLWSKYNRWFHKDIIEKSAEINKTALDLDQTARATRPIIEFEPNLKLINFGTEAKRAVDLVDDFTVDIFSTIEGSTGYNIDGIDLAQGMRILFLADPDQRVNGRIFSVDFIDFKGERQIALRDTEDSEPLENQTVLCGQGNTYSGEILYYNGKSWVAGQNKTEINQQPLFELFNCDEDSLADKTVYPSSDFEGTELFSYRIANNGIIDPELGFAISYRSIANVGDIEFEFDLLQDGISFCPDSGKVEEESTAIGYLRNYKDRASFTVETGWKKAANFSNQAVVKQAVADTGNTVFEIDMFDQSADIEDLNYTVLLNNSIQIANRDYTTGVTRERNLAIVFNEELFQGDVVVIKATSSQPKNTNGFYEIPISLERNPENDDLKTLTLGEINDHVSSIIQRISNFDGTFPGSSNLRDQANITELGSRIVKHAAPINLPLYHIVDRDANVVSAIEYAASEYAKFKRQFLQLAEDLPFSNDVIAQLDEILKEQFKDRTASDPFFYSDMIPLGGAKTSTFEITSNQQKFFALNTAFTGTDLGNRAVLVYLNGVQLVRNQDYSFNEEGFVEVSAELQAGDEIQIAEYENTNGAYVPPTPAKLGILPLTIPKKITDGTTLEPRDIVIGHDGSVTAAFGDYRDDILLELEKRIYNNVKINYDPSLFDIFDFVPGAKRNTGITREQLDSTILSDFIKYLTLIDIDYTDNRYFDRDNSFTYNYTGSVNVQGESVNGWWRSVYQQAYDTDAPHSRPWEMLGFADKPDWWESQYGPAPYTSNNLLLWEDLESGTIREPGKLPVSLEKFARPQLTSYLPVDNQGNLLSPLQSGYIKSLSYQTADRRFQFGDWSPVETAWRQSSQYRFYLLKALILNQPQRMFSTVFDRARQFRDIAGNLSYIESNRRLRTRDIVFPDEARQIFASGLVNYIKEYVENVQLQTYSQYIERLTSIINQMGFKVGGFTSKDKFNIALDSRTPTNEGNVFVPPENYQIFVNKTAPIRTIYYSGIIIEKQTNGFLIRGYNTEQPFFQINTPIAKDNLVPITVGGISEPTIEWTENRRLEKGNIVLLTGQVYRVTESHLTGDVFDSSKFVKIPDIPVRGGSSAIFNNRFESTNTVVPYNTVIETIQEVVDFILGYADWLEEQGFVFDYFENDSGIVADWRSSAKEFLFWTTQNWAPESVISLSPGAYRFKFRSETETLDDIYDTFYGYSLVKVDGKKLQPEYVSVTREDSDEFQIRTKKTADGIFGIRIATVQKEHAVLLDDKTVFNDIIFDKEAGFRQERIKVLGYRSADWNGSYNIPGFTYNNASVEDWQPWKDYAIGDLVRYKEFFYAAKNRVAGTETFESENWNRLPEKPESELIPNWDYKSNQFADFYDLDSDNFDEEQQKFAQHLIGYQNRQYLANIINDDVSQYKFYQGYIQEKGTLNALDKLFDVLSSFNRESLEFFEEWAIKSGQYGASRGFEEVEFLLDESKFKIQPQAVQLTNDIPAAPIDLVYRIPETAVYQKPENYQHAPFPEKSVFNTFTKTSGYVNQDDIDFELSEFKDVLNLDINSVRNGDRIWIGNIDNDWDVKTVLPLATKVTRITVDNGYTIEFENTIDLLAAGDFVGVYATNGIDGVYEVDSIEKNILKLQAENVNDSVDGDDSAELFVFVSSRFSNIQQANAEIQRIEQGLDRIWIDNFENSSWRVLDKSNPARLLDIISESTDVSDRFGESIAANKRNTVVVVGAPSEANGKVYIYTRTNDDTGLVLAQEIEANTDLAKSYPILDTDSTAYKKGDIVKRFNKHYQALSNVLPSSEFDDTVWQEIDTPEDTQQFGYSVAVSDSGEYIAVGAPGASNVKSLFRGEFDPEQLGEEYETGEIVRYQDKLWQALTNVRAPVASIPFGSFDSVPQLLIDLGLTQVNSERVDALFTGNYPFKNTSTDHFIVKAPADMYEGSDIGNVVDLKWNKLSYAYQDSLSLSSRAPFNNSIDLFDTDFLSDQFTIAEKIDSILYVDASTNIPNLEQIVETGTGAAEVAYTYAEGASVTIYVKNQNGTFGLSGSLFTSLGEFVGEYETQAPTAQTTGIEDVWSGYWKIDINTVYNTGEVNSDQARGLVYQDFLTDSSSHGFYANVLDTQSDAFSSLDTRNSEITSLTYRGVPGPNGVIGTFPSDLFVMRSPTSITGTVGIQNPLNSNLVEQGDEVEIFYNNLPNFQTQEFKDPGTIGLSVDEISKKHTVLDVWDGYIDVELTIADPFSDRFIEPKQGLSIEPVNFPGNGTAEIAFYQQFDGNSVRLYLKAVSGEWPAGTDFGEGREIKFIGDPTDTNELYQVDRTFGQVQSRSLGYAPDGIGRMVVLSANKTIPLQEQASLLDSEYWFYLEETVQGIPREANIPAEDNNDWQETDRLPAGAGGQESGLSQEGLFAIYQRTGGSRWTEIGTFIVPQRQSNARLGSDLKFAEINGLRRLFVEAKGNSEVSNRGRIYTIKNGEENGNTYNWSLGVDKRYKGEFSPAREYSESTVVFYDGELYQSLTNIVPGEFNNNDWRIFQDDFDFLGFLPNDTGLILDSDYTLDQEGLEQFSQQFDTSDNGEVVAVASRYDYLTENTIVIYRNREGYYQKYQTINAPNTNSQFGSTLALSPNGKTLAVGIPYDDAAALDTGAVYIYREQAGEFELDQILVSPYQQRADLFGIKLSWDVDVLAVTQKNSNSAIETEFDNGNTVFDAGFTQFVDETTNTGTVLLFEDYGDSVLYSQTIDLDQEGVSYFGRNLLVRQNHVYVPLPKLENASSVGVIADYRKNPREKFWNVKRQIKPTVDVSKIKQVFLYNVKTSQLVERLDFIDPLQGKIAGIADREISFKTYFDPAVYTNGSVGRIDETNAWDEKQIGKIWWDLTNAKFRNPYQGNTIFSANNWNSLFSEDRNSIDVYEWVETDILPSRWDELSGLAEGFTRGITGVSKYGNNAYVEKEIYDPVSKTFSIKRYFWVSKKTTLPNLESRNLNANDIADLIKNPKAEGVRFVQLISPSEFALVNCEDLITGTDVALAIQYWTIEDQSINIHNQYEIVTEGLESSRPSKKIEQKWFDSLVGFDETRRPVPALELTDKKKYGILDEPRQGWFVNRIEALKQTIERINRVLKQELIVDERDISRLTESEPEPLPQSGLYDRIVESELDLEFIGVAQARTAQLEPVIENGRIVDVDIVDNGRGYRNPPRVDIRGTGIGAEISVTIDLQGSIDSVIIDNSGNYYGDNTVLSVRRFAALVKADSEILGRWAIYERNSESREWNRLVSQGYNVNLYWNYRDWYMQGYSESTEIDQIIERTYQLTSVNNSIGDVIKIENVGSGGWLLLEKIDNQPVADYTVNYKTIGRQNGTIEFSPLLYDVSANLVTYDAGGYDARFYDSLPTVETRIILETVRDSLFTDDLSIEYNRLFFANLRYVFSEQNFVDWAFKTSFVKAQHNVGELSQKLTYKNDSLPSYEEYVAEVKPYRTTVREYLSSYEGRDFSSSVVTDFDLPPRYVSAENKILPYQTRLNNNQIDIENTESLDYPELYWRENIGFEVQRIEIADAGKGYTSAPIIEITGGGGSGATAIASIGRDGILTAITVTNNGSGYIVPPVININGSQIDSGTAGRAVAVLGGSPVRSLNTTVKFDRVSSKFEFETLLTEETFIGSGNRRNFDLEWPMDLRTNLVSVIVDGTETLGGQYIYQNNQDIVKGYERYRGEIQFREPPAESAEIVVRYYKAIDLLNAQDRINLAYQPAEGNLGKSLGQLMSGVDYGGVEVKSFGFESTSGWDAQPWFSQGWDVFDTDFEDEIIQLDGSTNQIELEKPLEVGITYNLYRILRDANGRIIENTRLDDPNYNTSSQTNPDAVTTSITGDGSSTIDLGARDIDTEFADSTVASVTIIIRKETSDGSFIPDPESFDTAIAGGDLVYQSATGIKSEDINIDGDGFVTPTTSKGPEEIVPGQVLDTVDIQVYERPAAGGSAIESRNYTGDGVTFVFDIGTTPVKNENVFVKVDSQIVNDFEIDYNNNQLMLENLIPAEGSRINILNLGNAGIDLLDISQFIGDGETRQFVLNTVYQEDIESFVTVNGTVVDVTLTESDDSYSQQGKILVTFDTAPQENSVINIVISLAGDTFVNYSQVSIDKFEADGSSTQFTLENNIFSQQPAVANTVVTVGNKVLNAGYSEVFEVTEAREYQLNLVQFPIGAASSQEIEVYLNGRELRFLQEWRFTGSSPGAATEEKAVTIVQLEFSSAVSVETGTTILQDVTDATGTIVDVLDDTRFTVSTTIPVQFDLENEIRTEDSSFLIGANGEPAVPINVLDSLSAQDITGNQNQIGSIVQLERGIGRPGDELKVYAIGDAEYRFGFYNAEGEFVSQRGEDSTLPVLNLESAYTPGDEITVYTFSNHDGQDIERQKLTVTEKTATTPETERYFEFRQLTRGLIQLRSPAIDAQYVWVTQNGTLLLPSIDYRILENTRYLELITPPNQDDVIEVIHFANTPVTEVFGWRQFKDMLNRTHYTRLSSTVELSADLNWYDKTIEIVDASSLPEPDSLAKNPGVLFIEGERIEYFVKDGSTLKQIRRGTLGTGIKTIYPSGTTAMEQGVANILPYRDREQVITITAGGYSDALTEYENSFGVSIDSISYDFNNNSAYPLGGQIATVKGTGFRENAQVIVGQTECETTFIDTNTVEFVTPALPVGAYDLVLINPAVAEPDILPRTTAVKPGAIEYLQILLPYSPSPETEIIDNPAADGDWYREPFDQGGIPQDYWQALDIEVFAAGKRLSKAPQQVYAFEAQDSPEGDQELQAEFAVNKDVGSYVRLSRAPAAGTQLTVIRKTLQGWGDPGTRLALSTTDIAEFLKQGSTELPR